MPVQTCSQAQQHKKTLPSTSEKMVDEANNRHATDEIDQLIEKALARQRTEMFSQFSEILMQVTANSGESSTQYHSGKINPLKVQMNMDILNLEGNIDVESVDNWVQHLEY